MQFFCVCAALMVAFLGSSGRARIIQPTAAATDKLLSRDIYDNVVSVRIDQSLPRHQCRRAIRNLQVCYRIMCLSE